MDPLTPVERDARDRAEFAETSEIAFDLMTDTDPTSEYWASLHMAKIVADWVVEGIDIAARSRL